MVERLFLAVPQGCLQFVIVVFPDHTHLLFFLFYSCDERDFMLSLSDNNQADVIEAFDSTVRYPDDLLHIENHYFEQMVSQI